MATDLVPIRHSDFVHRSGIGPKTVGGDDPGSAVLRLRAHYRQSVRWRGFSKPDV